MKREAKKTTLLNKYLRTSKIYGHIEYKQTRTNTFNLSNFEPHQLQSLLSAWKEGLTFKLSDADPREKPCDVVRTPPRTDSWICIIYPTCACFIHIEDFYRWVQMKFLELIGQEPKSISMQIARNFATYVVNF